jgi:hypothetical protein
MKMIIRNSNGSKSNLRTIGIGYTCCSKSWSLDRLRSLGHMSLNCSFSWSGSIHIANVNLIRQG